MAARFAVTTGNWSGAIWAATSGGTAGSAAVPTAADDATINKNTTVTVDGMTAVANTLTLSNGTTGADIGAIIQFSQSANTRLTMERAIATTGVSTASYMTTFAMDVSASYAYTAELVINNSASATDAHGTADIKGNYNFKGFPKNRHAVLTGAISAAATTATVDDATGWQIGDTIVFATTEAYNATPKTDTVTLNGSYTPGSATLTWTGGIINPHAADCPVGNFSSNCRVRSNGTIGTKSWLQVAALAGQQNADSYIDNVEFYRTGGNTFSLGSLSFFLNSAADNSTAKHKAATSCAFFDFTGQAIRLSSMSVKPARNNNIFFTTSTASSNNNALYVDNTTGLYGAGPDEDYVVFRASNGIVAQSSMYPDQVQRRHKISGCIATTSGAGPFYGNGQLEDCGFWSNNEEPSFHNKSNLLRCSFGTAVFPNGSNAGNLIELKFSADVVATDCNFPASIAISGVRSDNPASLLIVNKNTDAGLQELFQIQSTTVASVKRITATINRSTSSMEFALNSVTAQTYNFEVLAKAGETIRIIGFVRKSGTPAYGASTLPKITISGLGITPIVATMDAGTAADTWEQLTLDATNSGASDGLLTVTFTAQSATAGAKAWFAGIPVAPFVSRCRHYGYTFDETNPVRATNITVSANEATAAAYTGMTITWGASSSAVEITTSNTLQKLYDYTQAQGCLNVGSAMPLTGAGVAGSPALFAAGNITVSAGAVLNGNGSLSMGGFTILATEFSSGLDYSYTGGTWGQLSNSPTFAGGTLNMGAAATYVFATTGAVILSMTPAAPSTYAMATVTATGQLDLRNTTAHAITVELSSAAAALAITTNNTGGTITISAPQVYQQVPITNITTTSRVQIYDESAIAPAGNRELYNAVPGATSYTWTDSLPAAAARDIRVRIADVTGVTARGFIEASIGTCGVTEGTKSVSYRASQVADTTYNTNAVNGSLVTGITFTDAATDIVNVNIAGGSTTWQNIYAAFVYWISTAAGIADDIAYVDGVDPANYLLTSMKIKNTSSPSAPLTITGGFGRDATSGTVVDIIDTTGGNIYPLVDHVVSKVVTVGGVNVITGDIADIPSAPTVPQIVAGVVADPATLTVNKFLALGD